MVWGLDWLLGRDRNRDEEQAPNRAREAQEHVLAYPGRDAPAKEREAPQRPENEPRPGERAWPHHAERQRDMHDHPREPQKQEPEQEREATRMEYTRTAQPAPSMGGAGIRFTNSRAQRPQRDFADELLEQARAEIARQDAHEQTLERGRPSVFAAELEQARQDVERDRQRGGREMERDHTRERGRDL